MSTTEAIQLHSYSQNTNGVFHKKKKTTHGSMDNKIYAENWNTKITVFLNSKIQSHVIQTWYENLALIPIVGKSDFVSHTKHGSISYMIDNRHYVIFRIWEQDSVPWGSEIQKKRLELLGNTFNLHSNSNLRPRSVVSQSVSKGE